MRLPKMIVFDYGNTLCYENDFSSVRGEAALFPYIKENPGNYTPEEVDRLSQQIYGELKVLREVGFDHHQRQLQQLVYEYLGITHTISPEEQERFFWEGASMGEAMPGAAEMLTYLREKGIRTGVISNIGFSGKGLTERLKRLLPGHDFEFVIASSEYLYRKPSHWLFELALRKAGLSADAVWYCGDNTLADGVGASSVGMFPIWYDQQEVDHLWKSALPTENQIAHIPHLHIHHWRELVVELAQRK